MRLPYKITDRNIEVVYSTILREGAKLRKQEIANAVITISGHIFYFICVIINSFFFSCNAIATNYPDAPGWIKIIGDIHNTLGFNFVVFAILISILTLIIPLLICFLIKLVFLMLPLPKSFSDVNMEDHTELAQCCMFMLEDFMVLADNDKWDYYYPFFNGFELLIPFPFIMLPQIVVGGMTAYSLNSLDPFKTLLISLFFIVVVYTLFWRFSVYTNSLAYICHPEDYTVIYSALRTYLAEKNPVQNNKHINIKRIKIKKKVHEQ